MTDGTLTVQEARLAQAARAFQFDASLAPYNLGALQQWRALSCHITGALIRKVAPLNGANMSVTTEDDPSLKGPRTGAEERLAQQLQSKARMASSSEQAAANASHECADSAAASEMAGSARGADVAEAQGAPPTGKGVGRCFYTCVPRNVTVRILHNPLVLCYREGS